MKQQAAPNPSLSRVRERAGGDAGISSRMRRARGTVPACRPERALQVRARALRSHSTDAERLLWQRLRDRRLEGFKFRRQHPVAGYIADFACLEARLIVELDGGQHFEPEAQVKDQGRTAVLQRAGFTVLRFDNRQMLQETDAVLAVVRDWLLVTHPHPNPLPRAGEGASDPNPPRPAGEGVQVQETP